MTGRVPAMDTVWLTCTGLGSMGRGIKPGRPGRDLVDFKFRALRSGTGAMVSIAVGSGVTGSGVTGSAVIGSDEERLPVDASGEGKDTASAGGWVALAVGFELMGLLEGMGAKDRKSTR